MAAVRCGANERPAEVNRVCCGGKSCDMVSDEAGVAVFALIVALGVMMAPLCIPPSGSMTAFGCGDKRVDREVALAEFRDDAETCAGRLGKLRFIPPAACCDGC
mmetsp:Transcript_23727/g.38798  ORF Transcript_23727/g.38798 Transcript_23727/m.38798 type:complete len:104 (+) Transcript_23727:1789-2100(+)